MLFGLLGRKKNNEKVNGVKQYSVDISTNFDNEDRIYLKPIYTIKYYSKLNASVIMEAIFSKNIETGVITLNEAFLTLEKILNESIEGSLLINTMINQNCLLTNEEEIAINKLEGIIKY